MPRTGRAMAAPVGRGENIALTSEVAAPQYEAAERDADARSFTPRGAASIHAGDDIRTTN